MSIGRPNVGVVDIGTNSMRLLITDGESETGRWVVVTGLGEGVDATGALSDEAMARTIEVLGRYGALMDDNRVERRAAVATSATRDAANRDDFLHRATQALGVTPRVIGGAEEGRLSYSGATLDLPPGAEWVVSDIGGGSTEFVTNSWARSIDIGSVRLTDRMLSDRPARPSEVASAREHVLGLFDGVDTQGADVVGVAGTWTSLAAIDLGLAVYDRRLVHHRHIDRASLDEMIGRLAAMTLEETGAIPSLDPARAPVILAGAVVAGCVLEIAGVASALVSERDSLDGLASELVAVP
ncbi:MAG: Ppx/GppA phosphatase family protein [Acidimicrobiia bacterium]